MNYIQGTVKVNVYHNEDNSYTILKIKVTESTENLDLFSYDDTDYITITGYFTKPMRGEEIKFFGEFREHPRYGKQYVVRNYEKISETSIAGLIEYLSSDLFKGIGIKTAMMVVQKLGKDTIKLVMNDKDILKTVPKLSEKQIEVIYDGIIENKASENILIKLYAYNITPKMAMKIYKFYQNETIAVIEKNPYQLIYDIDGIGFERADEIAKKLGIEDNDPLRVKAMIIYLYNFMGNKYGHTYLYIDQLVDFLLKGLNKTTQIITEDEIIKYIGELVVDKVFYKEKDVVTLNSIFHAEENIKNKIKELSTFNKIDALKVDKFIDLFEQVNDITYTKLQRKAIHNALENNIFILTGGPGTGKTTVINGIVFVYCKYHQIPILHDNSLFDIKLVAPTGRAAKRMNESTKLHSETIHRLLGYSFDGKFEHNKDYPVDAKVIIVDEASMIDVFLASQLFQSINKDTKLIIVGDEDQLPSVGPGQVLKDLIDSDMISYTKLNTIHRQAQDSQIVSLAYSINQASIPEDIMKSYDDRYFVNETSKTFSSRITNIIDFMQNKGYNLFEDIQVLIPMYKGSTGIDYINKVIQEAYNPNKEKSLQHGEREFRVGDKVIQLSNQIEDNIMNGDQGIVEGIVDGGLVVNFNENYVTYKTGDLINLKHAYAMSIHKSQGSEYKVVILPIFTNYHIMLKRKLIYTAVTRAKEILVIIGDIKALRYGVESLEETRQTLLKDKIIKVITTTEEPKSTKILIHDKEIPFAYLGETFTKEVTPYDFMEKL